MVPAPGQSLLRYRPIEPIDQGGRDGAIKLLPDVISGDAAGRTVAVVLDWDAAGPTPSPR